MKKLTILAIVSFLALAGVPAFAMATHAFDPGGLQPSKMSSPLEGSFSVGPESDRPTWFSTAEDFGPSLAAGIPGGQTGVTESGYKSHITQDARAGNPDPRPRDPIPEPTTVVLLGSGLLAGVVAVRRYFLC